MRRKFWRARNKDKNWLVLTIAIIMSREFLSDRLKIIVIYICSETIYKSQIELNRS